MAYTRKNFNTKAALKRALAAGESVEVFQPGPFGPDVPDGLATLEGPHFPEAHAWYARVYVKGGRVDPSRNVR